MLPAEVIRKKRDGQVLSAEEIGWFIAGYVDGSVSDYQTAAMLMAIFFRGLSPAETADLTRAMMNSGITYDLKSERPLIDKHSTGGVGDKVSLALAPLAAACGLADPMVSGRGLGHTGGTLDKLESIPGFHVHLTPEQFQEQVSRLGVAMIGQSDDFVPADKKLYALRDVTATVESIPLVCSSILSKKAASGARGIVMDVKCGSGAFMSDLDSARALAKGLVETGTALDLPVRCLITNMNQPLGLAIGNAIEVIEAIECLQGGGPADLREIVLALVAEMLVLGQVEESIESATKRAAMALDDGSALEIFRKLVEAQGGDVSVVDEPARLKPDCAAHDYCAGTAGYVRIQNCRDIGLAALTLGAGRRKITDEIDPAVGIMMHAKSGDRVENGQPLATVYYRDDARLQECLSLLGRGLSVTETPPEAIPLIIEKLT